SRWSHGFPTVIIPSFGGFVDPLPPVISRIPRDERYAKWEMHPTDFASQHSLNLFVEAIIAQGSPGLPNLPDLFQLTRIYMNPETDPVGLLALRFAASQCPVSPREKQRWSPPPEY
ncbi:MAG: hypothetical protein ACREXW_16700, partial [Gammaproteobacteria bacterium]